MQTIYRLERLDISASATYWGELGASCLEDGTVGYTPHGVEELLILGLAATESRDHHAVAWALAERQRRKESSEAAQSMRSEAQAIAKLADALQAESEQLVVNRLLARLTERTQYAVRQQLQGH